MPATSSTPPVLPEGLLLARTTPEFTATTVPAALLAAHQTAEKVWGHLVVRSGSVGFTFEDDGTSWQLTAGQTMAIPPQRPHRVTPDDDAVFGVEFYK